MRDRFHRIVKKWKATDRANRDRSRIAEERTSEENIMCSMVEHMEDMVEEKSSEKAAKKEKQKKVDVAVLGQANNRRAECDEWVEEAASDDVREVATSEP